jgi:hypothetical protein
MGATLAELPLAIWRVLEKGDLSRHGRRPAACLAGGDVRFGGLYDIVGVGGDYDSDRSLARFASGAARTHGRVVSAIVSMAARVTEEDS